MSDPASIKTPFDGKSDRNDAGAAERLARCHGYRLLAVLLRHPKRVDWLSLQGDLKAYQEMLENLGVSWKSGLIHSLQKLNQISQNISQDEWIGEYEFCFGHTAHSKVSLYELEYGEEHSHREPQELADITAFYQAFGLRVSERSHERGDHILVECEFMHFLIFKIVYALERGQKDEAMICEEAARRFLSDHLARWKPAFAMRLSRTSKSEWMKAIADFCLSFILTECENQSIEAGDQNLPLRVIEEKVETGCVSCHLSPFHKGSEGDS